MERQIDILNYLPPVLSEVLEFIQLAGSINPELNSLQPKIEKVVDNCFIDTLNSYGCSRWEDILKITARANESLADRRFRIKMLLNGDRPYTMRSLKNKLDTTCGAENVTVEYANDEYTLTVKISLIAKKQFDYVKKLLINIVPANICINVLLLYNTHKKIGLMTHEEMKVFTHTNLREDVL